MLCSYKYNIFKDFLHIIIDHIHYFVTIIVLTTQVIISFKGIL